MSVSKRRSVRLTAGALVAIAVGVSGGVAAGAGDAPAAAAAAEPSDDYRAQYHFTVPDHWKNDPQRPVFVDGKFHYYYLYNSEYNADPTANFGTEWRLATSYDGVVFADQGVAAPKKTNANYDLWSGSTVLDEANTAGFGAGAVVMLVTQMDHPTPAQQTNASGPQAQFLWYSTDGGRNFRPYGDEPVIANGGRADFRDPKVVWDAERGRWVALIAERDRVSFYTSPDLKTWSRTWEYVNPGIGTIECPDLFPIRADDGSVKWVFGVSANGYATGEPATFAYWTGSFDGTSFTFDQSSPQWLDHGFDWYGAVTWEDPAAPMDRRYAVGWMNNWDYAHSTPTWAADGFNGTDSITREIRLKRYGSTFSLVSQPVAALADITTARTELGDVTVDGFLPLAYEGDAYQIEADVTWETATNIGLQLRRSADGTRHADVGVTDTYAYLNRGQTGYPVGTWKTESRTPFPSDADSVHLRILVDRTTIEVFVDDGRYAHSSQVFAPPGDDGIALYTSGGAAVFHDLTITEFGSVVQRPARLIADFEDETWDQGWTATGSFVGAGPSAADLRGQVGARLADTFVGGGDPATGTITSPPFAIDRSFLHFLVGGGDHPLGVEPATSVQLLIDGQPVRSATGTGSAELRHVQWDLRDLAGRVAQFQILDDATGAWGHLMVDHVVLSD
ncbi:GH32 C-terminal domain-containing protein [Microbacterium sp. M3]|uniref:GH32 C-terminal domain-containing protein n=1 Tax=Microbacterium arthrosphaerae TaxID=792652 RepID=A0ABU4H3M2_9MICO|nr:MULTISPECIES: GH32 C-terminal domain-containing protein [Microbacterium]MDW4573936.1 GH32 C-terminal domain-containing protein [Microbacterium arthrosphaerae]MDW7607791.1 GH32 C-terminal domain-containing protein [Microbacterium sp. M3]